MFDSLLELGGLHLPHHRVGGVGDPLVLDEVAELRGGVLGGDRLVEARGVRHGAHRDAHLFGVPPQTPRNLFVGGLALELDGKLAYGPADLPYLLRHVHGDPYGATLVGYGPLYGLPYPPRGVGGEPEAPIGVELLDGLHEPYVALLDEVLEGQPVAAILLGHGDDEPEVLLDEPLASLLIAGLGSP